MIKKAKIKVIKKGVVKTVEKPVLAKNKIKQDSVREIVSTVTNWVSDFRHRKSEETKVAIEKLFSQHPQTSGV
jgi:phenylpyruvate tautomerase PptA (4-oxalocrotonate tautomerase family)